MKRVKVLAALAGLQLVAILGYRLMDSQQSQSANPLVLERLDGATAPDLSLVRNDGSAVRLSDRRARPLLLHFWATWCPPCKTELPGLLEISRKGEFDVVAVSLDQDWSEVRKFFGAAVPPEVVLDGARAATSLYGLDQLPDTFLLDSEGRLRARFAGARDWRASTVEPTLRGVVSP
jgi:thiol-disulfide isomerase/thioredoxin